MKKICCIVLALPLLLSGCVGGDAGVTDPRVTAEPSSAATETLPDDPGTETAPDTETEPETEPETVPDPSRVTLMIEDFNNVADAVKYFTMPDLSTFGIGFPEFSSDTEYAQEGASLLATLRRDTWCQVYEIRGERLDVFKEAGDGMYLRMYVAVPDGSSVGFTFCLGSENGSHRSYPDASGAILTDISGKSFETTAGNDTDDAGPSSSFRVPAGFCGYVAVPLDVLRPWRGSEGISGIGNVDYLKLDVRPTVADAGDRYAVDALCVTDSPVAELFPGRADDPGSSYSSKNEEAEYMFSELKNKEATFQYCPEYDPKGYPGIKAVWVDGVKYGGKDTKFFAYIGFPEGASPNSPVPGVVLLHGGGGYAYPSWVKIWNDRGYAAIAVGNTGYYPAKEGMTDFYSASSWTREIPAETLKADPRIMPPDNDGMYSSQGRIDRMWMYHAVAQTMTANSLLRADPRVDADKVGVTGISWGGVITSVALGYDDRFAFAVPVYGSGYLNEAHSWMRDNFNTPGTKELWEPSLRLKECRTPILWLCWADDNCFSINSNSKSCLDTESGVLSVIQGMGHGHIEGWSREEIYRFADQTVKGGEPLPSPVTLPGKGRDISFEITVPADASSVKARVCCITEPLSYSANGRLHINGQNTIDQEWHFTACKVDGGRISAVLPDEAHSYYVEISAKCGGKTYITSTPFTDAD